MAARVLITAGLAVLLVGCPHDWDAFEGVPESAAPSAATAPDGGAPSSAAPPAAIGAPTVFATIADPPMLVVADADGIVLATTSGSVLACPHTGCASPTTIASGQKDIRGLAAAGGFVAWGARGDEHARRASRVPGGGAVEDAFEDDGLVAVALSGKKMFFAVEHTGVPFGNPGIRGCIPGETCHDVRYPDLAIGPVSELVIEAGDAFWLGDHRVFGCPVATCDGTPDARTVLADEPVAASALAADASDVVFASPEGNGSLRAVPRAALAGGGAPRTVASGVGNVTRLALTKAAVWTTNAAAGTVTRAPRTGGAPVVTATGLAAPTGIAAAAGHVYVACAGDGRVLRWEDAP